MITRSTERETLCPRSPKEEKVRSRIGHTFSFFLCHRASELVWIAQSVCIKPFLKNTKVRATIVITNFIQSSRNVSKLEKADTNKEQRNDNAKNLLYIHIHICPLKKVCLLVCGLIEQIEVSHVTRWSREECQELWKSDHSNDKTLIIIRFRLHP